MEWQNSRPIGELIDGALKEAADLSWDRPPPPSSDAGLAIPAARVASDAFPGYQVLKQIRAGGQAVVYLGAAEATGERVAIKVFRALGSTRERFRFEREVEALQGLCHPCITQILHASAESARPYIVMEYVAGWNLDDYLGEHDLDVRATMRLFARIAGAAYAAHQKGVIHRDVKPSNIRVDHNGEPHLFDFGLAKVEGVGASALEPDVTMTQTGQFLGTLYWVSPEQAEGRTADVDVRTDVYSLGMVLYYMLTGELPFERGGSMRDVLNRIATAPPVSPRRRRGEIDDDVETIVLKCLEKDPARRYGTAGELLEDVERWLDGRPILARRASLVYAVRKFVKRRPWPVAAGAAMVLLIIGATIVTGILWRRAESEAEAARRERDKSTDIAAFLTDTLTRARGRSPGEQEFVKQMMDEAASQLDEEKLAKTPETALRLHLTIGNVYFYIGEYARAREHFAAGEALAVRVHGPDHYQVANCRRLFAEALDADGRSFEARAKHEESLAIIRGQPDAPYWLRAEVLYKLANCLNKLGRAEQALPYAEEAMEICKRSGAHSALGLGRATTMLAHTQADLGMGAKSLALYRELLEMCRREGIGVKDGQDLLAQTEGNVGKALMAVDEPEEALPLLLQGLERWRAMYKDDHPYFGPARRLIACCLQSIGDDEDAARVLESGLNACRKLHPEDHQSKAGHAASLAMALLSTPRCAEAVGHAREAMEMSKAHREWPAHLRIVAEWALMRSLLATGDADAGLAAARRYHQDSPNLIVAEAIWSRAVLAEALLERARPEDIEEAAQLTRECAALYPDGFAKGQAQPYLGLRITGLMGEAMAAQSRFQDAEPLLLESRRGLTNALRTKAQLHIGFDVQREAEERLVWFYERWHAAEPGRGFDVEAAKWRGELDR